jgi:hypothetical protein
MSVSKAIAAVRQADKELHQQCNHPLIGEPCRRACLTGGASVIAAIVAAYKIPEYLGKAKGRLGIIVSPFEDCPKGFEEIIVSTPRNKKVKLCRLDKDTRKKWAPEGKPYRRGATKGALRRKRGLPRGVTLRPIPKAKD